MTINKLNVLTIILYDLIGCNIDLHNQNLGILRDSLIASGSLNYNNMIKYSLPKIPELPDNYILFLKIILVNINNKLDVALANTSNLLFYRMI